MAEVVQGKDSEEVGRGVEEVGGRGITWRPRGVEGAKAGLSILVADNVTRDDKLTGGKNIDDDAGRLLGGAKVQQARDATFRKVTVSNQHDAAKGWSFVRDAQRL